MDLEISNIALWNQQQEKFLKRTTTGHTRISGTDRQTDDY